MRKSDLTPELVQTGGEINMYAIGRRLRPVGRLRVSKARTPSPPGLAPLWTRRALKLEKSLELLAGTTWVRRYAQLFVISPWRSRQARGSKAGRYGGMPNFLHFLRNDSGKPRTRKQVGTEVCSVFCDSSVAIAISQELESRLVRRYAQFFAIPP